MTAPNPWHSPVTRPIKAEPATQLPLFPVAGERAGFDVRVSRRARHLAINVFPGGRVEVVAPVRSQPEDVRSFVSENKAWIDRAVGRLRLPATTCDAGLPQYIPLTAINQRFQLLRERCIHGRSRVREQGDTVYLVAEPGNVGDGRRLLRDWLKKKARRSLVPWLESLSRETQTRYRRVQVRGQRTRWGSYSHTGTLCLNYCLIFLPPQIVRYLMIHELCHTRVMSHSRRFWSLVGKFEPDYKRLDRALSESWQYVPLWASPVG